MSICKRGLKALAISCLLLSPYVTHADEALAQSKGCMACHQVAAKVVGPALKDVAAKYQGVAGAAETLVERIRAGSAGNWGAIPMPPNTSASDDELKTLAAWVLSL